MEQFMQNRVPLCPLSTLRIVLPIEVFFLILMTQLSL